MNITTHQEIPADLFKRKETAPNTWDTGELVGRIFRLSYTWAEILLPDVWKQQAGGIPQGAFLLAYYDGAHNESTLEAILLRVIEPIRLPQNQEISNFIERYKDSITTDHVTRYEYSFSGLRCSVLGCFYKDEHGNNRFGADLENFYSAHHYSVIKPSAAVLEFIVNYREGLIAGGVNDIKIGRVRYSSSQRSQSNELNVPVYVHAEDFAGKRTALFGMTRTGKSNTAKKIIQANVAMSKRATLTLDKDHESPEDILKPFSGDGAPKYPIGQIIFDINGEYANPLQGQGTALFDMFKDQTIRYSTTPKEGFRVMKVNFYKEIEEGFNLISTYLAHDEARFVTNFRSVSLTKPDDLNDDDAITRHDRKVAVYQSCLYEAGFPEPHDFKVTFKVSKEILDAVNMPWVQPDEHGFLHLDVKTTSMWWTKLWEIYTTDPVFTDYKKTHNREWADDDLKALLTMLTRKGDKGMNCAGFRILKGIIPQHTATNQDPFDEDILAQLRAGRIVIVDLSLGEKNVQQMFSERITQKIFSDAMKRFTNTKPNNFIQFYFEEAHNLFPKKEEKNLLQIYSRLAKEGAKLNLGLIYATQEVTSISNNILKATQNWFISHLNNQDEIKELTKYYDFGDFTENLIRFSQGTDKGFVRMKTYSNAFVVPVQIDKFASELNVPE